MPTKATTKSTKSIDKLKNQKVDGKKVKGGFSRSTARPLSGDVLSATTRKPTTSFATGRGPKLGTSSSIK